MAEHLEHTVPTKVFSQRIQEYAVGLFEPIATKSALKKALKKNLLTVNGIPARTATLIRGGELICFYPKASTTKKHKEIDLKLKVLFEDDYLAAVEKPAGILVSGNSFKTVANALKNNLENGQKAQPVHRLDYPTTGVLLIGKTASSIRALNKLFVDKKISKTYYAVTMGSVLKEIGHLNSPVDGKEALTEYKILTHVPSERFEQLNLVKLNPQTGRKHQLRVQLSQAGSSILGDPQYSPEQFILKGKGMYLHAHSIEFIHPFTGEKLNLKAPLPEKFTKLFPAYS